jgi:hypothetical protein
MKEPQNKTTDPKQQLYLHTNQNQVKALSSKAAKALPAPAEHNAAPFRTP